MKAILHNKNNLTISNGGRIMIRVDIKKDKLQQYRTMIKLAKRDGHFKACGNPDDPWIILKFETEEDYLA